VFPDTFIGKAESFGLIDQLGWLVVNRGLAEIPQFALKDGGLPTLSLNVSAYSLTDLGFPDKFVALTEKHEVPAERIILEITESGLIQNLSSVLDILIRLRMKKVQLSIDDFGTGFAMMQQLRNVPATELKIDKSFVQEMHEKDSARIVVQKTIEIGHELGMKVLAEGVETAEQLEFLRDNRCDLVQGYFFSRPLPIPALLAWLKKTP
jgi:EAL domain-containing protein (putative c-di-GMP-specific phosphodiesterase class I)